VIVCVVVSVEMEERRDYISWRGERNCRRNLQELNKGVESQESIRKSCDWDPRWRPFSSDLRGPPRHEYAPGRGGLVD